MTAHAHSIINQSAGDGAVISVVRASARDETTWDDFVADSKTASFFHRFAWSHVISQAYGYEPYYLIAKNADRITGILPLIYVNSAITGKALISTAFTVGGGILADDVASANALVDHAKEIGEELNVQYIELRQGEAQFDDWLTKDQTYAGFQMSIAKTPDEILKSIPRKRRAELRKSLALVESGELTISEDPDLDRFYDLYSHGLRDLGTPVFPKKFVRLLQENFGDSLGYITILHRDKPVTALLSFYHHNTVLPYYVGALPEARVVRAFDLVYWQQLLIGAQRNIDIFDFGRSKVDTGSYGYKKTWGIVPTPLAYQYQLIRARDMPDINPNNPKFALATKVWRKLPVNIATMGGSVLARHFA